MSYSSLEEVLEDAERIASQDHQTLGNLSAGQIFYHIANSLDLSIDGVPFSMPAPVRFLMKIMMKNKILSQPMSPGYQLPKQAQEVSIPVQTTVDEVECLKKLYHPL